MDSFQSFSFRRQVPQFQHKNRPIFLFQSKWHIEQASIRHTQSQLFS